MSSRSRAAAALAAAALAAGCASTPAPGTEAWTSGRLSLRVEATAQQPAQNQSAAFELRGGSDSGELRLISPLGQVLVATRWSPAGASLRSSEGERHFESLDALSRQALGEAVPLAALPDWLAGRPWPGAPHQLQAPGFAQLGWLVHTDRLAQGWLTAQRSTPPAVLLRVKLDRGEP